VTTIAPLPNTTRRSDYSRRFPSLYRHGLAEHRKGDAAGGDADIAAAKAISADVTESFERFCELPTGG